MQSFFWTDFKRQTGWDTYKIGVFEGDVLVGGTVAYKFDFSKTKNFIYIPGGPVLPYEDDKAEEYFHGLMGELDSVVDLKGDQRTTHVRIEPRCAKEPTFFSKFRKAPYNMEPRNTMMLDLSKSKEELLSQMKPKGRYNIKVAERSNVQVMIDDSEVGIQDFLKLYETTTDRNKFEGKDDRYFYNLITHLFKSEQGHLFFAVVDQKVVATALVVFYGDRATYFFGASANEDREKMAPYKLHWEIALFAKQQGYKWYDFWGVAPLDADSSHGWHGLSQFKRKFGGEEFEFVGAYDFVYNPKLYREFLEESKEIS